MQEIFSVKNKTVLITGASSGIGQHFAITLAKYGANIILVGRNQQRLQETEQTCQSYNVKTFIINADIGKNGSADKIVAESRKHFNTVDVLINAAGIAIRVPTLELTEQQWEDVMKINVQGTFAICQAVAKWMIASKNPGKIINISSSAAFHTTPARSAYSASKLAVESLTRTLALNLVTHNIQVNCIAPGFFITNINRNYLQTADGKAELGSVPMQRAADVKELEGVLLLLASNASSYMTGAVLHIDGGFAIHKV